MKKLFLLFLLTATVSSAIAQSWVSKTAKSVFTLTTFKADGSLIASTTGFYAGAPGECVSSYTPFKGAASAVIIDGKGKKFNVTNIIACDDTYDVCRFTCENNKTTPIDVALTTPAKDEDIYVLPYAIKNAQPLQGTVKATQLFNDKYTYYTLALPLPDNAVSAPVLNGNGELVGIAHKGKDTECYATDIHLAVEIMPNAIQLSLIDTSIPALLPSDNEQAMIALFVAQQKSRDAYEKTLNQFVRQFPDNPEGYVRQAQLAADKGEYNSINSLFDRALSCAEDKASIHNDYSRLIAAIASREDTSEASEWTFERSLAEIDKAIEVSQQPIYYYQRANVLMHLDRWRESVFALNKYVDGMPATALDADVYHLRFLAEQQSKMFQQALDDINKAIELDSHILLYHVEKTQLLIRLNLLEEALHAAEETIATDATYADGYLLLGIIQCQQGQKEEGLANLRLAQDKGSTQAQQYLEKLK